MVRRRQIHWSGLQTPSQTAMRIKARSPHALCKCGNTCRSYPGNPQATQQAWKKKVLRLQSITTVYTFPSFMQRCLTLDATMSPLHRAASQTLHMVRFSPASPQQEIFWHKGKSPGKVVKKGGFAHLCCALAGITPPRWGMVLCTQNPCQRMALHRRKKDTEGPLMVVGGAGGSQRMPRQSLATGAHSGHCWQWLSMEHVPGSIGKSS